MFNFLKRSKNESDDHHRTIYIYKDQGSSKISVRGLIDPVSGYSLVARKVVEEELGVDIEPLGPGIDPYVKQHSGTFELIGTVELEWYGENPPRVRSLYTFDPKRYKTVFYVPREHDANYDVLIGKDTIHDFGLLRKSTHVALNLMSFSSKTSKADKAKEKEKEEKKKAKKAQLAAIKARREEEEEQRRAAMYGPGQQQQQQQ